MKIIGILILSFCFITFSCKTKEVVSPKEFDGNQMILTHGGGFAGTYKTYCLLENGQLFKSSNQFEANNPVKGFNQKIVDQIFSNYEILGLGNEEIESYDNLNYSITMINKEGEKHKSIWGSGQKGAEKHQLFYDNIMNQIRLNNENGDQKSKANTSDK